MVIERINSRSSQALPSLQTQSVVELFDLGAHQELLARIESLTGREVDVAAACGLGRRPTPEQAFEAMREAAALIAAAPATP